MVQWYVYLDGEKGPLSSAQLKQLADKGTITPETKIRREADTDWVAAARVKGLFSGEGRAIPTPPPVPSAKPPVTDHDERLPVVEPVVPSPATPPPAALGQEHDSIGREQHDLPAKLGLAIGGLGLMLLALSPLFKWISLGAGGITGVAGDGKIVLAASVVAVVFLGISVFNRKGLTLVVLSVGAWGTVAVFWMGGLIWKVSSILESPELDGNPFAAMLAVHVSPGAGLYLGLIGGLVVAGALGTCAVHFLRQTNQVRYLVIVQTVAVTFGAIVAIVVGPDSPAESTTHSSPFESASSDSELSRYESALPGIPGTFADEDNDEPSEAELAARKEYIKDVVLRNVHVGDSYLSDKGVFGEIKNVGNKTLKEVTIRVYCLDSSGQPVSEDTFHPVRSDSWASSDNMLLRPNYATAFGYKLESTSDWSGKIRVDVTDIAFAEDAAPACPAESDPEKQSYLPKIELRDVSKGESTLGETGVFGEVKNCGERTLAKIEVVIYCLDSVGKRVFEKHYCPVLVSDSTFSIDPDKPLKPNYTEKFGCKMGDAPSDWSGRVEVIIFDIAFASQD